ncbi:hypothetical protein D3C76_1011780 [compost metagenome]
MVVGSQRHIQTRTKHDQQVAVLQRKVGPARCYGAWTAAIERVLVFDDVHGQPRGHDRYACGFDQLVECINRTRHANATAGDDAWALGLAQ